jgi:hypothetical protein
MLFSDKDRAVVVELKDAFNVIANVVSGTILDMQVGQIFGNVNHPEWTIRGQMNEDSSDKALIVVWSLARHDIEREHFGQEIGELTGDNIFLFVNDDVRFMAIYKMMCMTKSLKALEELARDLLVDAASRRLSMDFQRAISYLEVTNFGGINSRLARAWIQRQGALHSMSRFVAMNKLLQSLPLGDEKIREKAEGRLTQPYSDPNDLKRTPKFLEHKREFEVVTTRDTARIQPRLSVLITDKKVGNFAGFEMTVSSSEGTARIHCKNLTSPPLRVARGRQETLQALEQVPAQVSASTRRLAEYGDAANPFDVIAQTFLGWVEVAPTPVAVFDRTHVGDARQASRHVDGLEVLSELCGPRMSAPVPGSIERLIVEDAALAAIVCVSDQHFGNFGSNRGSLQICDLSARQGCNFREAWSMFSTITGDAAVNAALFARKYVENNNVANMYNMCIDFARPEAVHFIIEALEHIFLMFGAATGKAPPLIRAFYAESQTWDDLVALCAAEEPAKNKEVSLTPELLCSILDGLVASYFKAVECEVELGEGKKVSGTKLAGYVNSETELPGRLSEWGGKGRFFVRSAMEEELRVWARRVPQHMTIANALLQRLKAGERPPWEVLSAGDP